MKNKKYVLLASLYSLLLLSSLGVSANDDNAGTLDDGINQEQEVKDMKPELRQVRPELREAREEFKLNKEEVKEKRENLMEQMRERKMEMQDNISTLKNDFGTVRENFKEISQENKDALETLKDEHEDAVESLKEKLENTDLKLEERDALRLELKTLNDEFIVKVKEIVGENPNAAAFVEKREEVRMQNQNLREENKTEREKFRENRKDMVEKYKEKYANTLAKAMPKIKAEKLDKVSIRINNLLTSIEESTKISQVNKDKLLSQIIGLKEIMDEELEARNQATEELNLDELFQ